MKTTPKAWNKIRKKNLFHSFFISLLLPFFLTCSWKREGSSPSLFPIYITHNFPSLISFRENTHGPSPFSLLCAGHSQQSLPARWGRKLISNILVRIYASQTNSTFSKVTTFITLSAEFIFIWIFFNSMNKSVTFCLINGISYQCASLRIVSSALAKVLHSNCHKKLQTHLSSNQNLGETVSSKSFLVLLQLLQYTQPPLLIRQHIFVTWTSKIQLSLQK